MKKQFTKPKTLSIKAINFLAGFLMTVLALNGYATVSFARQNTAKQTSTQKLAAEVSNLFSSQSVLVTDEFKIRSPKKAIKGKPSEPISYNSQGNTIVKKTYSGGNSNTSKQLSSFNSIDLIAPTINCPANIVINNTPGLCIGTTSLTQPVVNDNSGNALDFSSGGLVINNPPSLTNWTIETWVYVRNNASEFQPIYMFDGDQTGFYVRGNNHVIDWWYFNFNPLTGTIPVAENEWHHLACTYDGTDLKLYVDGVFDTSTPIANLNLGTTVQMGADGYGQLNGSMDEFRIWDYARSQSEIQSKMNSELSAQASLVLLYHFNQGVAGGNNSAPAIDFATDDSGNGFTGTLGNFALTGATNNWVDGLTFLPTITNNAPLTYPIGNTTIVWTATDASGNTSTCNQLVTVIDNEAPTITCPADVTINNTIGLCTGTLSLTQPVVNNNCGDRVGNALEFSSGGLVINNPPSLTNWTIETWVYVRNNASEFQPIYMFDGDQTGFYVRGNNHVIDWWYFNSNPLTGTIPVAENEWHHLACSYDGTELKLYVDGVFDTSTPIPNLNLGTPVQMGADGFGQLYGSMDEFRVWDYARSQSEIQSKMNSELNPQAGLVLLYHFNQGVAAGNNSSVPGPAIDFAIDNSGNGFTGTLSNFAFTGATNNWVDGLTFSLSVTSNAPSTYPKGNTTIVWTANDASGNTSTCTQQVTVIDNEAPTITCSADVTINNTPGLCTGSTPLSQPVVNNNCVDNVGNAFDFNSGVLILNNPPSLTNWTIETWVYVRNNASEFQPIYMFDGDETGFFVRGNNHVIDWWYFNSDLLTGAIPVAENEWHHLACTYDGTVLKLYVDGVFDTSTPIANLNLGTTTQMGSDDFGDLNGAMDEFRIWDYARSQSEIQSKMNSELNPQSGLVLLYHFNQGVAAGNNSANPGPAINSVKDASGQGYTGLLYNCALTGATDNWVDGKTFSLTVTNNAPSTYPIGNTTIVWTATDASGNTSTCNQLVTVIDNEAPTITCPVDITVVANDVGNTYSGNIGTATGSDNCGTPTISVPSPAGPYSLGTTIVTWTATDAVGNSTVCTQTVTVTDQASGILTPTGTTTINASAYPNPTSGAFTVAIVDYKLKISDLRLEVVNVLGEVIYQSAITNQLSVIDISTNKSGMYFIKVSNQYNNIVFTTKLMKE